MMCRVTSLFLFGFLELLPRFCSHESRVWLSEVLSPKPELHASRCAVASSTRAQMTNLFATLRHITAAGII
eukprot:830908-Pelagomonas_calceolata.AAC.1